MGISRKLWSVGNSGLKNDENSVIMATTHMEYSAPAGFFVAGLNFG